MTAIATMLAGWWARFAVAGMVVLLLGWLLGRSNRQPVRRLRAGSLALAIALLALPLAAVPAWIHIPLPILAEEHRSFPEMVQGPRPAVSPPTEGSDFDAIDDAVRTPPMLAAPQLSPVPADKISQPVAPVEKKEASFWQSARDYGILIGVSLWFLAALLQLGWICLGQIGLERQWAAGYPVPEAIQRLFARTKGSRNAELRMSDRITSPLCFGVSRPRVLLPRSMAQSSPVAEQPGYFAPEANERVLGWVFAHELDHLRRRDPLMGWLIGTAQAVYFWCPWFWKLRRDIRLAQEELADDAAVRSGTLARGNVEDYASFLVRLSGSRRVPAVASAVRTPCSDLFWRVTMLLNRSGEVESASPRRWAALIGGGLLSVGLIFAGISASPIGSARGADDKPVPKEPDDDAIRKAIEALKKGPEKKAPQKEEEDPNPPPARSRPGAQPPLRMPAFPNFPQIDPQGGLDPDELDKMMQQYQQELQNMIQEMQRQLQQGGLQPGLQGMFPGGGIVIGPGGLGGFGGGFGREGGRGRLGVRLSAPTPALAEQLDLPADKGLVVEEVVPDSPAAKAGLKANDVIVEFAGRSIDSDPQVFVRMVREAKGDEAIDMVILRKGKKETIKGLKLPQDPRAQAAPQGRGLAPAARGPGGGIAVGGGNMSRMSVQLSNDDFTITEEHDGIKTKIVGSKASGTATPTSIEIDDNGTTSKADSVEKVNEKYRDNVTRLLKSIR